MAAPDSLPVRDDLRGQVAYGAPQLDVAVRLNVNENPYPPSEALVAAVAAATASATRSLNRYPDRDALALRSDLAAYLGHGLDRSRVWAANGSNEIMHQLFLLFGGPGRSALSFAPTYSMYPEYARDTFTRYLTEPRRDDFTLDPELVRSAVAEHDPDILLLTSPNNPTGTSLDLPTIAAACAAARGVVVVDEAYAEFRRPGTPTALELLGSEPRLIVTRTMSKAFSMAGARVGYLAASSAVVDGVQLVRLPYHLSSITQAVARTALAHADELLGGVDALRTERDSLVGWLRQRGFRVAESDANFVLFGLFQDRHAVWEGLLGHGVLVRETGPEGWLRVSAGTPQEMAAFRAALEEVTA